MKSSQLIFCPLLLILLFLLTSCDKGYEVRVTNYYIEPLDSVVVGDNKLIYKSIALETTSDYQKLAKGKYQILFITKTKKRINSSFSIPSKGTGKRTIEIDAIEQVTILED